MSLINIRVDSSDGDFRATVKALPFLDVEIVTTNSDLEQAFDQITAPVQSAAVRGIKKISQMWVRKVLS